VWAIMSKCRGGVEISSFDVSAVSVGMGFLRELWFDRTKELNYFSILSI